jgi:hypothetical protein
LLVVVLVGLAVGLTVRLLRARALAASRRDAATETEGDASPLEARDQRILELEARLAQPPRFGVHPSVAALVMAGCVVPLYFLWPQTEYFFSSREAIQLGAEGDYRFELARDNRYVELHGTPTSRAGFGVDGDEVVVAVGVRDTPVMVWRRALRGEEWKPGTRPPPPNQQPFTVRGRLIARDHAPERYHDAFKTVETQGEVNPRWVLIESARPGGDLATVALSSALIALAAFAGWLAVRGLLAMKKRSKLALPS